jgi:hypothetical protein
VDVALKGSIGCVEDCLVLVVDLVDLCVGMVFFFDANHGLLGGSECQCKSRLASLNQEIRHSRQS